MRVIGTLNSTKFTPAFATGNLITDPYFNSLSTYAGWGGGKVITTDTTEVYSGSRSLKMTGDCGASVDFALNGKIKTNSKYRLRVMAKTSGTGKYKVMVNGFNVVAGVDNFIVDLNTGGAWKQIDTTFTSGSTLLANQNLFINSCEGYGGTLAIIDNYELYLIPATDANLSDLKVNGTTATGFAAGTITYNVVLPFGTTAIPVVAATVNEPNATTVITQAASVNGSATVEVTAQDGTTKKTYTINFSVSTVGNPTIADNSFVSVKPTISSSDFMVEFAGKLGKISVIDSRGRLVSSKVASNSTEVISVPSAGIYTIQINVNGAIKTVKVVKTK